jgi:serine/threonine protein kinase
MAPELVNRKGHSFPADIWSIGCVVIEMLTSKPPYSDQTQDTKRVLQMIRQGIKPNYPAGISKYCQGFLDSCLQIEPEKRLNVKQLL